MAVPSGGMSQRTLKKLLVPLIDSVSDDEYRLLHSADWAQDCVRLHSLIHDPDIWETIFGVKDGHVSNYILHELGSRRVRYLKKFRESMEVL